jgi:DNA-directed RNA polymerase subunit beta
MACTLIDAADSMTRGEVPKHIWSWKKSLKRFLQSKISKERCHFHSAITASNHQSTQLHECKERDITYAAPLFVTAEFTNNITGEIKSQTVFMGDFPINDSHAELSLLTEQSVLLFHRSFVLLVFTSSAQLKKHLTRMCLLQRSFLARGAWLEFEVDKKDLVGVRIDRKRKQSVTVFLKALGWTRRTNS